MAPLSRPLAAPARTEHGARVELRLVSSSDPIVYAARFLVAGEPGWQEGRIHFSPEAGVELEQPAPAVPAWALELALSLVRTTARAATKDGSWPRRLTRWRKGPAATTNPPAPSPPYPEDAESTPQSSGPKARAK